MCYNGGMEKEIVEVTSNADTVTISRAEYEEFKRDHAEVLELRAQIKWLMEQLRLIQKKQFGASSEHADEGVMEQMSLLFNEAEVSCPKEEELVSEVDVRAHKRARKSGKVRDIVPENIPVEVIEHRLPEAEQICPQCGATMEIIGKEVKETLKFKPAEAVLVQDVYYTYGCPQCKQEAEVTPILETAQEPAIIPNSYATPEAVAYVAVQKFVMCVPLYRQEMEWNSKKIMITRQTMANWLIRCATDWFQPVYDELHHALLQHDLLHADETVVQVLHEEGRSAQEKSYMWLYRTSGDAEHGIVLYEYQPGRGQEHPARFLSGFRGYLQTDGYGGYNGLESVIRVGCWAHARRKFEEAQKALPKGQRSNTADQGVAYCTRLFKIEEKLKALSPDERKQERLNQEKPVLDDMLKWANTRNAAPKSKLGQALTYLRNQWEALNNYLLDGRIELSNNRAERSIKPFVMARKNFLFANTARGAQSSATIFSLIETARENGVDPFTYLCWVLKRAPVLFRTEADWAKSLLPWNMPDDSSQ